jgi:hypothetical protein
MNKGHLRNQVTLQQVLLLSGEPFIRSQEIISNKETREVVVQATHFMLIDEATQIEIEQELAENKGVTTEHDTNEKKEETTEEDYGVNDLHGHPDSSKIK